MGAPPLSVPMIESALAAPAAPPAPRLVTPAAPSAPRLTGVLAPIPAAAALGDVSTEHTVAVRTVLADPHAPDAGDVASGLANEDPVATWRVHVSDVWEASGPDDGRLYALELAVEVPNTVTGPETAYRMPLFWSHGQDAPFESPEQVRAARYVGSLTREQLVALVQGLQRAAAAALALPPAESLQ